MRWIGAHRVPGESCLSSASVGWYLNVLFHVVVPDGVFDDDRDGLRFAIHPVPTSAGSRSSIEVPSLGWVKFGDATDAGSSKAVVDLEPGQSILDTDEKRAADPRKREL